MLKTRKDSGLGTLALRGGGSTCRGSGKGGLDEREAVRLGEVALGLAEDGIAHQLQAPDSACEIVLVIHYT